MQPNKAYAPINLEAHSFHGTPADADNVVLTSYRQESDVRINYSWFITIRIVMCKEQPGGNSTACEATPFKKWCDSNFNGDELACVFNVMPHIMRANKVNRSAEHALAANWVSATCERHDDYLSKLTQLIPIDHMGGCHHSRDENTHPGVDTVDVDSLWWGAGNRFPQVPMGRSYFKVVLASRYRFYLSMENTIMDDYVTEKFYQGFMMDTVMVYLGAPNARRYAPAEHSYVDVLDFDGPAHLAAFLTALAGDEARYQSYFWWRRRVPAAISPWFRAHLRENLEEMGPTSMLCRMCSLLTQQPLGGHLAPAAAAAAAAAE